MCGIAGILGPESNQPERQRRVRAMAARIAHRGPDGEGFFDDPAAVFGHRRLAIIDLDTGAQPMYERDGRYVIVFNGEIYNYIELRQQLVQQGEHFRTTSDTEVLLKLLCREGEAALKKLIGMFAFMFYDRQTRQWIMARDHFGIKPLYWTQAGGELIFASEIKALFAHPAVRPRESWEAMQEYFVFQFCLNNKTLFEGVHKVEPGTYVAGEGAEIKRTERYWDFPFHLDEQASEEDFAGRLRELVRDSIRMQIRSDVPLGAYLSGGLDSTVVTMLTADILPAPLQTFHGRFLDGEEYDESRYAQAAADHRGAQMHIATPTAADFVRDMPRLMYMMDEPMAGPGLFPQYHVTRLAREHVKVILGGQGGDELFCGYARYLLGYLEQALKGAIHRTQEEGKHIVTLTSIVHNLPLLKGYEPLMRHFWSRGLFEDMDRRYFWLLDRGPDIEGMLSADARARWSQEQVFENYRQVFHRAQTPSYINKMQFFDLQTLLPALLHIEDRVSMAASIESRVPLLDHRVAELVGSVPPPMKFKGGDTKHLFKQAFRSVIPDAVMGRKDKMGFPVPLPIWLRTNPVRDFVGDTLAKAARRPIFDGKAVDKMMDPGAAAGRRLWGILSLELWYEQMVDGA